MNASYCIHFLFVFYVIRLCKSNIFLQVCLLSIYKLFCVESKVYIIKLIFLAGYRKLWHSGGIVTFTSQLWMFPDANAGVFVTASGPLSTQGSAAVKVSWSKIVGQAVRLPFSWFPELRSIDSHKLVIEFSQAFAVFHVILSYRLHYDARLGQSNIMKQLHLNGTV